MRLSGGLVASVVCALAVFGCGSGGVVASVAGVPISAASVRHWMRIESIISYRLYPTKPVPRGVVGDPPAYTACIAWLGSAEGPVEARSWPVSERKKYCERRLRAIKQKTLGFLLLYQWYVGELKAQHITIPEAVVRRNMRRLLQAELPGRGEVERYLAATGLSEADLLFISKLTTYGEEINKETFDKPNETEARRALNAFTSRWIDRTDCQPGYVVPGCRQYHGAESAP